MSNLRPRRCELNKGSGGYGFHLHGEKGKSGQFIRLVESDTPASAAGLRAGDRLAFVNGDSVEGESHQQVVARIRATAGALELIVVDAETAELLQKHGLQCRKEFVTEGIPLPAGGGDADSNGGDAQSNGTPKECSDVRRENGDAASESSERLSVSSSTKEERGGPRPRLCRLKKGSNGYGFNLHSEKSRPGQFIRAVDDDSPAQRAGLKPQDKILQVNGLSVVGLQHTEVVAAIKAGGDETALLVIDAEAEEFFKRCNVLPTEEHVTGPLPEPASDRASEEEVEMRPKVSVSSSASSASNTSLPAATSSPSPAQVEKAPEPPAPSSLGLSMSLAEAREQARQKRSAKKAPKMDWSKRNELFSNL